MRSLSIQVPVFLAALLLALTTAAVTRAQAAEDDYVFCIVQSMSDFSGETKTTRYYSAIFLGDYSFTTGVENDFYDYLKEEAGVQPNRGATWCFKGNSLAEAEREYASHVRDDKQVFRVVHTKWAPDDFTNRPLQDFTITVPAHRREVTVCVRDHECEDGDDVRVSVNGGNVFSGEIVNDWACSDVAVTEGRNAVELYAVNGSGRKGNCSYADANTGEIRVSGENVQTQSWRHRGGAGSSASIIVTVQ